MRRALVLLAGLAFAAPPAHAAVGEVDSFPLGSGVWTSMALEGNSIYVGAFDAVSGSNTIKQLGLDGAAGASWSPGGQPLGLDVDPSGNVWVADYANHRIKSFSAGGTPLGEWGVNGTDPGKLHGPRDLAATGSDVFVVDGGNNRVQRFSTAGVYATHWSTFDYLVALTLGPGGSVWTAETGADQIQQFTDTGSAVSKFGSSGSGDGQLNNPYDLEFAPDGTLWVADPGNMRIQHFTAQGEFLEAVSVASGVVDLGVDAAGRVYVIDDDTIRVYGELPDPLTLKLSGKKRQALAKAVTVAATCSVACTAVAKATVTIAGARAFGVRSPTVEVPANEATSLRMPLDKAKRRRVRKALEAGKKVVAETTVKATNPDATDEQASGTRSIRLTL